ncbi:GyrI-like domain-containing protein [Alkalihalobacillus sp. CinArs1]|uniref:GyrI-like domain-containing protein n=1 Tax=Alkalihalobacillus sp. CinArs1 TaxID=2995314 RepID=UPI0022DD7F65|nr:GyrI-like domain-containing protein [Alkalihalobacillus sp. CinArs1]
MEKLDAVKIKGVEEIGEKKLVGFRVVCKDMAGYAEEIPKASQLLVRRKNEIKHLVQPVKLIGAFKAAESTEDDGYWVCFEVEEHEDIPEDMVSLTVPKEKRAVLTFKGYASDIFKVYSHLHEWIDENGYKRVPEKWTLELYSKWTEDEDVVELCDPVR